VAEAGGRGVGKPADDPSDHAARHAALNAARHAAGVGDARLGTNLRRRFDRGRGRVLHDLRHLRHRRRGRRRGRRRRRRRGGAATNAIIAGGVGSTSAAISGMIIRAAMTTTCTRIDSGIVYHFCDPSLIDGSTTSWNSSRGTAVTSCLLCGRPPGVPEGRADYSYTSERVSNNPSRYN